MPPTRIISLLPAATEMVCALGASQQLVACSHECDFPTEVSRVPSVTAPNLNPALPANAINEAVNTALAEQRPLFRLKAETMVRLNPDLILTQGQCAVCAISPAELQSVLTQLPGPPPEVLSLTPAHFVDLWTDLRRVGIALGLPDEGRSVIGALKARVVDVLQQVAAANATPTVACLEWLDPLMGAGNWIPELVELAGATPVLGLVGIHSGWITFEQLAATDPEVIVALPCGFNLTRTRQEFETFLTRPGWSQLRAVREGRVYAVDGSAYFNRPGPRLVDSLELLAELLHPSLYPEPQYQGTGWVKLDA